MAIPLSKVKKQLPIKVVKAAERKTKKTADQVKAANVDISEADLSAIVEEALEWARNH